MSFCFRYRKAQLHRMVSMDLIGDGVLQDCTMVN